MVQAQKEEGVMICAEERKSVRQARAGRAYEVKRQKAGGMQRRSGRWCSSSPSFLLPSRLSPHHRESLPLLSSVQSHHPRARRRQARCVFSPVRKRAIYAQRAARHEVAEKDDARAAQKREKKQKEVAAKI